LDKVNNLVFKTESGGFSNIDVHTLETSYDAVYYGSSYDEAVSGKYRSNLRGFRMSYSLLYSKCLQPSAFLDLLNYIVEDITNGLAFVLAGTGTKNMIKFVPDSDLVHKVQYANGIGRYVPKLSLTSFGIFRLFPSGAEAIDWRYIDEGVIDSIDYVTITDPGLLEEEEYGSI